MGNATLLLRLNFYKEMNALGINPYGDIISTPLDFTPLLLYILFCNSRETKNSNTRNHMSILFILSRAFK